jgi:hypothetical protein
MCEDDIARERDFYETTKTMCECGKTPILPIILSKARSCSHSYSFGVQKPIFPADLWLGAKEEPLANRVVMPRFLGRESLTPDEGHRDYQRKLALKNVRRFNRRKQKDWDAIKVWAEERLEISGGYALGLPLSVLELISEGIKEFRHKRED